MRETLGPRAKESADASGEALEIVDCDVHNYLTSPADLEPYLSPRWREYLRAYGFRMPNSIAFFATRPRKQAARSDSFPPSGKPAGSDPDFLRKQLLDEWSTRYAILNPLEQIFMGSQFAEYSAALCSALNDYTKDVWLASDPRLYASICVPEDGDLAALEIERLASDSRFVQVLLNCRTREPLGTRRYWKIYEAATAFDLPVAIHVGGVGGNMITGAGWPSYYYEDHADYAQAFHAQLISLVCEGVFERYPKLNFVFEEGGFAWVAALMWTLDSAWKLLGSEIPRVCELPSTYIRRHCWFTTQPIEEPERPEQFSEILEDLGMSDHLLFSTDYPHWDFDAPDSAIPRTVPMDLRRAIMGGNAMRLYRLPSN